MATSNNNINIFQKLEKFSGKIGDDLSSWLRSFDRCCLIAGKDDDLVKGQLLTLCLCGQALAVVDRLEAEKATPQKYSEIKAKLTAVFNSAADKECKQQEFENRHLLLNESEDEFMLSLLNLHRAANPDTDEKEVTRNVKRKFLNNIPSELKKNIFLFCNNPHDTGVTVDILMEAVRKAKLYILDGNNEQGSVNVVSNRNDGITENNAVLKALESLKSSLDTHINSTNERFREQEHSINTFSSNSRRNGNNRFGRGNFRNRGRGNRGRGRGNREFVCYRCNGPNHIARNCNVPLNANGHL